MSRLPTISFLPLLAVALACPAIDATSAQPPRSHDAKALAFVRFYEGNNGSQSNFCTVVINSLPFFKRSKMADMGCSNDEARSMKLQALPPGSRVYVYDDPNCGDSDDWQRVTVMREANELVINTFERSWEGDWSHAYYRRDNGLDGKVSCIIIDVPAPPSRKGK